MRSTGSRTLWAVDRQMHSYKCLLSKRQQPCWLFAYLTATKKLDYILTEIWRPNYYCGCELCNCIPGTEVDMVKRDLLPLPWSWVMFVPEKSRQIGHSNKVVDRWLVIFMSLLLSTSFGMGFVANWMGNTRGNSLWIAWWRVFRLSPRTTKPGFQ